MNQAPAGAPFVLNNMLLGLLSIGTRITGYLPDLNDHFRLRRQFFIHDNDLANFERTATIRTAYFESIDLYFNGAKLSVPRAIGAPSYFSGVVNVTLLPGWNFIAAMLYDNRSLAQFDLQVKTSFF